MPVAGSAGLQRPQGLDQFNLRMDAELLVDARNLVAGSRAADPARVGDPNMAFTCHYPARHVKFGRDRDGRRGRRCPRRALGSHYSFCLTSDVTRCYTTLAVATTEFANARVWGGVHWRFDADASLGIGASIGAAVLDARPF